MKMFKVLLTVLSIASIPSAHAAAVGQVQISANAPIQNAQLVDQRLEPIYESQPYNTTCNREVIDHVVSVCETVSDQVCHGGGNVCETVSDQVCNSSGCTTVPRRVCRDTPRVCQSVPRRVCHNENRYRTEFYSCVRYRDVVVGHRVVKTLEHNIEVAIDRPELLQGQVLGISLVVRDTSLSASLVTSFGAHLLTSESQVISSVDRGAIQTIVTRIIIHVDVSTSIIGKILGASIQELQLNRSSISMRVAGAAELAQILRVGVILKQDRLIDKRIINDSIDSSQLSLVTQGNDLLVTIPLSKMGAKNLKSKRHDLNISISLMRPALHVLNSNDMSAILNKKIEAVLSDVTPN